MAVLAPYAVHQLGLGASGVGVIMGLYGAGMLVGALLAPAVMRRVRFGAVVAIGPLSGLAGSIAVAATIRVRSEEHTSELQSLMRISYAVFCLKKKNKNE